MEHSPGNLGDLAHTATIFECSKYSNAAMFVSVFEDGIVRVSSYCSDELAAWFFPDLIKADQLKTKFAVYNDLVNNA